MSTSPAQRLLSRRTKTLLPTKASPLQPKVTDVQKELRSKQDRQSVYYDRSAKDLDTLKIGDHVRVQPFAPYTVWRAARVLRPVDTRSYEVQLENDRVIRRNRRHLRRAFGGTPMDTETVDLSPPGTAPTQTDAGTVPDRNTDTHTRAVPDGSATTCTEDNDMPATSAATTRCGRTIVRPQRYKDFVPS